MMINLNDSDANRILVHFKIKYPLHYTTPYTICQYVTPKFLLRHKWKIFHRQRRGIFFIIILLCKCVVQIRLQNARFCHVAIDAKVYGVNDQSVGVSLPMRGIIDGSVAADRIHVLVFPACKRGHFVHSGQTCRFHRVAFQSASRRNNVCRAKVLPIKSYSVIYWSKYATNVTTRSLLLSNSPSTTTGISPPLLFTFETHRQIGI